MGDSGQVHSLSDEYSFTAALQYVPFRGSSHSSTAAAVPGSTTDTEELPRCQLTFSTAITVDRVKAEFYKVIGSSHIKVSRLDSVLGLKTEEQVHPLDVEWRKFIASHPAVVKLLEGGGCIELVLLSKRDLDMLRTRSIQAVRRPTNSSGAVSSSRRAVTGTPPKMTPTVHTNPQSSAANGSSNDPSTPSTRHRRANSFNNSTIRHRSASSSHASSHTSSRTQNSASTPHIPSSGTQNPPSHHYSPKIRDRDKEFSELTSVIGAWASERQKEPGRNRESSFRESKGRDEKNSPSTQDSRSLHDSHDSKSHISKSKRDSNNDLRTSGESKNLRGSSESKNLRGSSEGKSPRGDTRDTKSPRETDPLRSSHDRDSPVQSPAKPPSPAPSSPLLLSSTPPSSPQKSHHSHLHSSSHSPSPSRSGSSPIQIESGGAEDEEVPPPPPLDPPPRKHRHHSHHDSGTQSQTSTENSQAPLSTSSSSPNIPSPRLVPSPDLSLSPQESPRQPLQNSAAKLPVSDNRWRFWRNQKPTSETTVKTDSAAAVEAPPTGPSLCQPCNGLSELVLPHPAYRILDSSATDLRSSSIFLEDPLSREPWYKDFFYTKEHINFFGDCDEGEFIASLLFDTETKMMRIIFRTKKKDHKVLHNCGALKSTPNITKLKQWVEILQPTVKLPTIKKCKAQNKLAAPNKALNDKLKYFEERQLILSYKIGIVYCKYGQSTETEMMCNERGSEQLEEFLNVIGTKIPLIGWTGYRAGLDIHNNETGTHSVHTDFQGVQVMFHVATLLPYSKVDTQQVEKKRHIGNDICVIIFRDNKPLLDPPTPPATKSTSTHSHKSRKPPPPPPPEEDIPLKTKPRSRSASSPARPSQHHRSDSQSPARESNGPPPFDPTIMVSEYNHVFIVVERVNLGGSAFGYRLDTVVKDDVPDFKPAVPRNAVFTDLNAFRETILTKVINGEQSAYSAAQFRLKILRTRQEHISIIVRETSSS